MTSWTQEKMENEFGLYYIKELNASKTISILKNVRLFKLVFKDIVTNLGSKSMHEFKEDSYLATWFSFI